VCWIAVKGRAVEIGTRRALGANAWDIFAQILIEAALLSCVGCAAGLALGWRGSKYLALRNHLPFLVDWPNVWFTLAVAVTMNFLFAFLPAVRAARVSPIRALRSE
jgi:ABC-type antimicrobial peptide transport system permease subunit